MVVPSGIEMTVSLGQSEKLPSPKVVSVVGNSMFSKDLQPAKHQLPSDVIPLDITIFERFAQEPNALFPIVSTLDGKYNSVSFEQLKYLQPIITQYFIDNKSEIWLLFLIAHSKR